MLRFLSSLHHSFRAAGRGLVTAFKAERTFRVMAAAGLVVIILVLNLPLERWERLSLIGLTGGILVLELLNSMVERLVDLMKPRLSAYVGEVKDLTAAAVLLASGFAAILAILILLPHVTTLIGQF